ncbi:helix-turn-helix domain-containing protein [Micromonospora sp. NBC_01796]|uniref:helix-turn-helix domain-containing protein n=1 Tax=Micromonospora sp. NBC_01796 TaxID=2975987 RepID=UPI002DD8B70A|nr:helix-turn-helix domain-containing protein [Micromonospora sp. NBC_01796]WSA89099.1 helix-turn-helix domain-containing protein [Micromonospora sp. NBC_01796]
MPLVAQQSDDDPRRALRAAGELRRSAERAEALQVRRARNAGLNWPQIALALGVTHREVRRRYGSRYRLPGAGRP